MTIYQLNYYMVCIFMYKYHHSQLPAIFDNMFITNDNVYTYSTRQRIMYQVPRCRLESKRNSLCFIGVRYFNTILSPSNLDILYSRQALCFSSAEYASPVWSRSSHASKIDPVLNAARRTISGIALPHISDGQCHPSLRNTNKKTTICILSMNKIQPERE